jgi:hypothetical protein
MVIQNIGNLFLLLLNLAGCMIHFQHRLPNTEEFISIKQYCLTQGDTPWNQVSDRLYKQVIDNEQKNSLITKSDFF